MTTANWRLGSLPVAAHGFSATLVVASGQAPGGRGEGSNQDKKMPQGDVEALSAQEDLPSGQSTASGSQKAEGQARVAQTPVQGRRFGSQGVGQFASHGKQGAIQSNGGPGADASNELCERSSQESGHNDLVEDAPGAARSQPVAVRALTQSDATRVASISQKDNVLVTGPDKGDKNEGTGNAPGGGTVWGSSESSLMVSSQPVGHRSTAAKDPSGAISSKLDAASRHDMRRQPAPVDVVARHNADWLIAACQVTPESTPFRAHSSTNSEGVVSGSSRSTSGDEFVNVDLSGPGSVKGCPSAPPSSGSVSAAQTYEGVKRGGAVPADEAAEGSEVTQHSQTAMVSSPPFPGIQGSTSDATLPEEPAVTDGTVSNGDQTGSPKTSSASSGDCSPGPRLMDRGAWRPVSALTYPDAKPGKLLASQEKAGETGVSHASAKSEKENGVQQRVELSIQDQQLATSDFLPLEQEKSGTQMSMDMSANDATSMVAPTVQPADNLPGLETGAKQNGSSAKERSKAIDVGLPGNLRNSDPQTVSVTASAPSSSGATPVRIPEKNASVGAAAGSAPAAVDTRTAQDGLSASIAGSSEVHPQVSERHVGQVATAATATGSEVSSTPTATVVTPTINSAQLIQSMHQSEMKLGMNSVEFGQISISTAMTRQVLSAQISVDHAELGRVLAIHLPGIEDRLGSAYGLQARVEVRENNPGTQGGAYGQDNPPRQGTSSTGTAKTLHEGLVAASLPAVSMAADTARLDIRI
jgi:hypothetical protein